MGKRLRCEFNGVETHDRFVETCCLDWHDIGATVIAIGLALDCPRFSGGRYTEFELEGAGIKLARYCK